MIPRVEERSVLLRVENLHKRFPVSLSRASHNTPNSPHYKRLRSYKRLRKRSGYIHAADGVNLEIAAGESLGLVGESGCGKSTTGRMLVRLDKPDQGRILLTVNNTSDKNRSESSEHPEGDCKSEGSEHSESSKVDIAQLNSRGMTQLRRQVQMIFQDPYESINPRRTVFETISEPLTLHRMGGLQYQEKQVAQMLQHIGLTPPELFMLRYPHELSGGQRQRVAIARALILQPQLVIADEPTSMLDMSVRASIMRLMSSLARELGVAYLYITHDLAVARHMCDSIAVMYLGKIVEIGPTEQVLNSPAHPYTQALISAVPLPDPSKPLPKLNIDGAVDNAIDPPPECRFLNRCTQAIKICSTTNHPPLQPTQNSSTTSVHSTHAAAPVHMVACHLNSRDVGA